jgi:hypothetical protein
MAAPHVVRNQQRPYPTNLASHLYLQTLLTADAEAVLKRNAQIIQQWTAALKLRHSGDNSPQNNARIEQCSAAMQSSIQLLARLADSQGRPANMKHEDIKAGLPPSLYSLRVQPVLEAGGGVPQAQIPQQAPAAAAMPRQAQPQHAHAQHAYIQQGVPASQAAVYAQYTAAGAGSYPMLQPPPLNPQHAHPAQPAQGQIQHGQQRFG